MSVGSPSRWLRLPLLLCCVVACERGHEHGQGHGHAEGYQHSFADAQKWAEQFEASERDTWQQPAKVIEMLALAPASRVADIGSATGYFPTRVAAAVPQGRVWGIDIAPQMVGYLNRRARAENLANLFSIHGLPDDPLIPEPVDVIMIVDTYHHIGSRPQYFARLRPSLRPGGRLAIIDFREGDLPVGPPDHAKVAPEVIRSELEAAGYRLAQSYDFLVYQYFLVFAVAG